MNIYDVLLPAFDSRMTKKNLIEIIENPDWEGEYRAYDWKNYIPKKIKENWRYLSWDAKAIMYLEAENKVNENSSE